MWLKKTIIIVIIVLASTFLFLLYGGGILLLQLDMLLAHDKDITQKDQYWGGYERDQIYELVTDVFLELEEDWSKRLMLVPPARIERRAPLWSAPQTIAEYKSNQQNWPQVVGIVNTGTRIRCTKLRKYGSLLWGSSIYVFAEILDGPHKGKTVDIDDISAMVRKEYRRCILNKPDHRILKKVEVNEKH